MSSNVTVLSTRREEGQLEELKFLADYLYSRLNVVIQDRHKSEDDSALQSLKSNLENLDITFVEDKADLGKIYNDIIGELTFPERKKYGFPNSFVEFSDNYKTTHRDEHLKDVVNYTAEALILGELENGLASIVLKFRQQVRNRALSILIDDNAERDVIGDRINSVGEDEVLNMLKLETYALVELSRVNDEPEMALDERAAKMAGPTVNTIAGFLRVMKALEKRAPEESKAKEYMAGIIIDTRDRILDGFGEEWAEIALTRAKPIRT